LYWPKVEEKKEAFFDIIFYFLFSRLEKKSESIFSKNVIKIVFDQ
jgi:hypothetical protein